MSFSFVEKSFHSSSDSSLRNFQATQHPPRVSAITLLISGLLAISNWNTGSLWTAFRSFEKMLSGECPKSLFNTSTQNLRKLVCGNMCMYLLKYSYSYTIYIYIYTVLIYHRPITKNHLTHQKKKLQVLFPILHDAHLSLPRLRFCPNVISQGRPSRSL